MSESTARPPSSRPKSDQFEEEEDEELVSKCLCLSE